MKASHHHFFDLGAVALVISGFLDHVPQIGSLIGMVYFLIEIWESETVRGWLSKEKDDGTD